jgi:putative restriction endonuclease
MEKIDFYVGNTDHEWFNFLRDRKPDEINFWQPGGQERFHALKQGDAFLLRLKSPVNKIAGIGFFSSHSLLPIDFAWEVFQEKNGIDSYTGFRQKIISYRDPSNPIEINPRIGCIILTNPLFFNENDWIPTPSNWHPNIVKGKRYDSLSEEGKLIWNKIELLLHKYRLFETEKEIKNQFVLEEENLYNRYGAEILSRVRLGQGAFRVLITDAYERKCAISGERTLPVLDAAHIKPYDKSGPHSISNGILLRTDLHKLFDKGYLTITNDYKIEVSRKIKEEFENGRDYYKYHGNNLITLPSRTIDKPSQQFIDWHHQYRYKG